MNRKKSWSQVRLGEVLRRRKPDTSVEPTDIYHFAGVYSFGRGVFRGQERRGSEFAYENLTRLRQGEFVYPKLMAWEGAFGIVPADCDGCYVSPEFPVFQIDTDRLVPPFLGFYFQIPGVWESMSGGSTGTNIRRRRLNPADLLQHEIPLPPLVEQQRVVAQIEERTAQIREARTLRHLAAEEAEALHLSVLHQHFVAQASSWTPMAMDEAVEICDKQVDPTLSEFSQLPHISGQNMEGKTCRLLPWRTAEGDGVRSSNYLFAPGTILYSKIRPYLCKAVFVDFRGVCSADIYPIRVKSSKLDPHFVKWSLVAEPFTQYANRLSGRTRMPKLNRKQLFAFGFSHPRLLEQRRIVSELNALQVEVDALKRLQAETAAEIDALIPAVLDRAFRGTLTPSMWRYLPPR